VKPTDLLFDTSVYIGYKLQLATIREPGWFSVVVMQELMAGAEGRSELLKWRALSLKYQKKSRLLVPYREAWDTAGTILHRLLTLEKTKTGKRPAWSNDKKQSIIRDVLIAVSAKKKQVTVVSDNKDFPLVAQLYDFRWITAWEFFS
jgi:predicted nucleic acid-binding protein